MPKSSQTISAQAAKSDQKLPRLRRLHLRCAELGPARWIESAGARMPRPPPPAVAQTISGQNEHAEGSVSDTTTAKSHDDCNWSITTSTRRAWPGTGFPGVTRAVLAAAMLIQRGTKERTNDGNMSESSVMLPAVLSCSGVSALSASPYLGAPLRLSVRLSAGGTFAAGSALLSLPIAGRLTDVVMPSYSCVVH